MCSPVDIKGITIKYCPCEVQRNSNIMQVRVFGCPQHVSYAPRTAATSKFMAGLSIFPRRLNMVQYVSWRTTSHDMLRQQNRQYRDGSSETVVALCRYGLSTPLRQPTTAPSHGHECSPGSASSEMTQQHRLTTTPQQMMARLQEQYPAIASVSVRQWLPHAPQQYCRDAPSERFTTGANILAVLEAHITSPAAAAFMNLHSLTEDEALALSMLTAPLPSLRAAVERAAAESESLDDVTPLLPFSSLLIAVDRAISKLPLVTVPRTLWCTCGEWETGPGVTNPLDDKFNGSSWHVSIGSRVTWSGLPLVCAPWAALPLEECTLQPQTSNSTAASTLVKPTRDAMRYHKIGLMALKVNASVARELGPLSLAHESPSLSSTPTESPELHVEYILPRGFTALITSSMADDDTILLEPPNPNTPLPRDVADVATFNARRKPLYASRTRQQHANTSTPAGTAPQASSSSSDTLSTAPSSTPLILMDAVDVTIQTPMRGMMASHLVDGYSGHLRAHPTDATAINKLGWLLEHHMHNLTAALVEYRKALENDPHCLEAHTNIAAAVLKQASHQRQKNQEQQQKQKQQQQQLKMSGQMRDAVHDDANEKPGSHGNADTLLLEAAHEARYHFEAALAIDPHHSNTLVNYGTLLIAYFDEKEEGRRQLEKAVVTSSDAPTDNNTSKSVADRAPNFFAMLQLASAYEEHEPRRVPEARRLYDSFFAHVYHTEAASSSSSDSTTSGHPSTEQGKESLCDSRSAVIDPRAAQMSQLTPSFIANAHHNFAVLLNTHFQHEYEVARAHYERAIRLHPRLAASRCGLAALLVKYYSDYNGAKQQYEAALRWDPNHEAARRNLESLLKYYPVKK